jgi:aminoglycoside 2'-N-acetyltransferase I
MLAFVIDVVVRATAEFSGEDLRLIRDLLDAAFDGSFSDDDWEHTVGGLHVVARQDGGTVAHAAVVPRTLVAGDRPLSVGYVESVATRRDCRHRGHATRAMQAVGRIIARGYDLGALSTGVAELYRPLGWESWRGPTYVQAPDGPMRTADEDDAVMVLRTDRTRDIDLTASLTCDWRAGDVW